MDPHLDDRTLRLVVAQALSDEPLLVARTHLATCAPCRRRLEEVRDASSVQALGRVRLHRVSESRVPAVESGPPSSPHVPRVAELLGISEPRAATVLDRLHVAGDWGPGASPGVQTRFARGGEDGDRATSYFIRLEPGATLPWRAGPMPETLLVLEGRCRERGGPIREAGEELSRDPGSETSIQSVGTEPTVALVVVHLGVDFVPGARV